jgi:hypothetical protein
VEKDGYQKAHEEIARRVSFIAYLSLSEIHEL